MTLTESPDDRRVRIVVLTKAGKDLILPIFRKYSAEIGKVFADTNPKELQIIENVLKKASKRARADLTYDLTANWSVGGKYAYRLGQESLDRVNPNFFDNSAQLTVLRVDWRFLKQWESMAEVRTLNLTNISERRRGALAAIYHHVGKNLKAGVGYNFTDFSDDLTDLKYNHKAIFLNLIATK